MTQHCEEQTGPSEKDVDEDGENEDEADYEDEEEEEEEDEEEEDADDTQHRCHLQHFQLEVDFQRPHSPCHPLSLSLYYD